MNIVTNPTTTNTNINSRLKGAVDRELGGEYIEKNEFSIFYIFAEKTNFIMRFLRIRPVQKVIDNPTQLSGRGFPRISHMRSFSSQLYLFWYSKIEAEPRNSKNRKFEI